MRLLIKMTLAFIAFSFVQTAKCGVGRKYPKNNILFAAAVLEDVETISEICDDGYDLNLSIDRYFGSLLHVAVLYANTPMVRTLVGKCHLDINNDPWGNGKTPYHFAIEKHRSNMAKLLVELGADPLIGQMKDPIHLLNAAWIFE